MSHTEVSFVCAAMVVQFGTKNDCSADEWAVLACNMCTGIHHLRIRVIVCST